MNKIQRFQKAQEQVTKAVAGLQYMIPDGKRQIASWSTSDDGSNPNLRFSPTATLTPEEVPAFIKWLEGTLANPEEG